LVWTTAEGFGGPYKAGSTDIGTAIIYVLVFAGLYLAGAGRTLSVDAYLRRSRFKRRGREHHYPSGDASLPRPA
jgi:nitrite reductase (NO-forming)